VREERKTDKFCNILTVRKPKGGLEYFHEKTGGIHRRRKHGEPELVLPRNLVRDVIALNHNPIFLPTQDAKERLKMFIFFTIARGLGWTWRSASANVMSVREEKKIVNTLHN
jgi:hypothetical protein